VPRHQLLHGSTGAGVVVDGDGVVDGVGLEVDGDGVGDEVDGDGVAVVVLHWLLQPLQLFQLHFLLHGLEWVAHQLLHGSTGAGVVVVTG